MALPPVTSPKVTKELCAKTQQRLVFHPHTMQEAEFIARQLLSMGFSYYKPAYAGALETALDGSIYFDTDRTIMVNDKRDVEGIACTAYSFDEPFLAQPAHPQNARLTLEDCLHGTLAFYPRFLTEARRIVRVLLGDGVTTDEPQGKISDMGPRAVAQGLLVHEGRISFGPSPDSLSGARICTAADLGVTGAAELSAEQSTILSAFNEMAARMGQMSSQMAEMARRIETIEKEVLPGTIDKPAISGKIGPRKTGQP